MLQFIWPNKSEMAKNAAAKQKELSAAALVNAKELVKFRMEEAVRSGHTHVYCTVFGASDGAIKAKDLADTIFKELVHEGFVVSVNQSAINNAMIIYIGWTV